MHKEPVMPMLDYSYYLGQTVYHIDKDHGIRDAVVKKIEAVLQYGNQTLSYTIAFRKTTEGFAVVDESTLFPNADSAWDAYKRTILEV